MNRVKRLALVTALPVGAALAVAIAPAFAATGGGSGNEPSGAVAAYELPYQLMDETTKPPTKETTKPPTKETTKPPTKETTPPPTKETTTPPPTRPTTSPAALPVTGSDRDPNVIWLVAGGLLTAGSGLLLFARRLRHRFES